MAGTTLTTEVVYLTASIQQKDNDCCNDNNHDVMRKVEIDSLDQSRLSLLWKEHDKGTERSLG